jgi:hypothetical protein
MGNPSEGSIGSWVGTAWPTCPGLAGGEVSGPEPDAERRVIGFHDGADRENSSAAARTALQNTRSGDNAEGLGWKGSAIRPQTRADKAVRPAAKANARTGSARRVIREQLLKLRERLGESQIVALVNVHTSRNGQTPPLAMPVSTG